MIFGIVLFLLIGSMFFSYPDIVRSEVTLTYEHPATWVVANNTGKIQDFYVMNGQTVNENDLLAIINNNAVSEDVATLKKSLDSLHVFFRNYDLHYLELPGQDLKLGDIQDSYIQFYLDCEDYTDFMQSAHHRKKINAVTENLNTYLTYKNKLEKQNAVGNSMKGTPESSSVNNISRDITGIEVTISELKLSLVDLQLDFENQLTNKRHTLRSDYERLLYQISLWESKYLLKAGTSGKIIFTHFENKNHTVKAGENVFAIVPDNPGKIVGKTLIPAANAVKVTTGQRANIKLDGYPSMEYGILTGQVLSISLIPIERVHLVELKIPEDMQTSYGKKIDFNGEISGTVEIITENVSLFNRILNPVRNIIKNK